MFFDAGLAEVAAAGKVAQEVGVAAADDGERGRQAEDFDELPFQATNLRWRSKTAKP